MLHVAARARPGTLLFHNWAEGLLLWRAIVARIRFHALVVMPDHVHVLIDDEQTKRELVPALVGFAQARNARRRERGSAWRNGISTTPIRGSQHARRSVRYLHLNPTRRGLVNDPLAWPLSTHRDCVGLALPPVRSPRRDAASFHAWVSGDPSVSPEGTLLPQGAAQPNRPPSFDAVRAAVSSLSRALPSELARRGPARTLLLLAAREFCDSPPPEIARLAGVDATTVRRATVPDSRALSLVARVLQDSRFPLLGTGDLRRLPAWHPYVDRR